MKFRVIAALSAVMAVGSILFHANTAEARPNKYYKHSHQRHQQRFANSGQCGAPYSTSFNPYAANPYLNNGYSNPYLGSGAYPYAANAYPPVAPYAANVYPPVAPYAASPYLSDPYASNLYPAGAYGIDPYAATGYGIDPYASGLLGQPGLASTAVQSLLGLLGQ